MLTKSLRTATLVALCVFFVITGCKSKDKQADQKTGAAGQQSAASKKSSAPQKAISESVDVWDEPLQEPAPTLQPIADPDAVVDRYNKECTHGANSPVCHELRLQVERVFLEDLVAMRAAGEDIDRKWYRVAASSGTPQLKCIGLRELLWLKDRTSDEDALIIAAFDSPWPEVRRVSSLRGNLPQIMQILPRAQFDTRNVGGVVHWTNVNCFSDLRDPQPGLKWAGNYPGARFRFFASNDSLRWFTTTDPVEKVLDYFNRKGKKPMTEKEMAAAASAKMMEEMNKITEKPDPDDEKKLMDLITGQSSNQVDWVTPFRGLQGTGEVRYVMLSPKQAIAIFRDDILHATSIVASRPKKPAPIPTDMKQAEQEAHLRFILGI